MTPCPDCHYLHQERLAIAELDGKLPYAEALRLAQAEHCTQHAPRVVTTQLGLAMREALDDPEYRQPK